MTAPDRNKIILGLAMLAVAMVMVYRAFTTSPTPAPARTPSSRQSAAQALASSGEATAPAPRRRGSVLLTAADPVLQLDLLDKVQAVKYEGPERNIFQFSTGKPKPLPNPVGEPIKPTGPPPPPPPPPIPLKFYGFTSNPGEPLKRAFLTDGEDVFIAGEGDVVKKRYKILHIGVNTIEVEDVESHNKQSLPLLEG